MDVTVIITNYKTPILMAAALKSLRKFYNVLDVILIDNGSQDNSADYIRGKIMSPNVSSILLNENVGHGPAMHMGFEMAATKYVFTLDTDCVVTKGGFIEEMIDRFRSEPRLYAIGWLRFVNGNGVPAVPRAALQANKYIKYVHPHAAMFEREKYFLLPPFKHTGAPCTRNMEAVKGADMLVADYPIQDYVDHMIAGTRRMWGGRWDFGAEEPTSKWKEDAKHPI